MEDNAEDDFFVWRQFFFVHMSNFIISFVHMSNFIIFYFQLIKWCCCIKLFSTDHIKEQWL
jgi:hypothetical protein